MIARGPGVRLLSIAALCLSMSACSLDMGEGLLLRADTPSSNATAPSELEVYATLEHRDEPIEMHWLTLESPRVTMWIYSCEPLIGAGELELTPWDETFDETACDGTHLLYEELRISDDGNDMLAWASASGTVTVRYDAATDTADIEVDAAMMPQVSYENDLARGRFDLSGSIHLRETGQAR